MKFLSAIGDQLLKWKLQDWLLLAALVVACLASFHIIDPAQVASLAATVLVVYKLFRQCVLLADAAKSEPLTGQGQQPTVPPLP